MEVIQIDDDDVFETIQDGAYLKLDCGIEIQILNIDILKTNADVVTVSAGPILRHQKRLNDSEVFHMPSHLMNRQHIIYAAYPVKSEYNTSKQFFHLVQKTNYNIIYF